MSVTTDGPAAPTGVLGVTRGPTVAVLSPVTGGFYFGGILSGIAREVAAVGGQVRASAKSRCRAVTCENVGLASAC